MGSAKPPGERRCPVCGRGTLRDLSYDEGGTYDEGGDADDRPRQQRSDSRELQLFSCGHEVPGSPLDTGDSTGLDVERRGSEETVDPPQS